MAELRRQMTGVGAGMANAPWPDEMNMFEPYLTVIMWFDKAPEMTVLADAFEKHLWPCHRFNSCIEGRMWVQRQEIMDRAFHFAEENSESEEAIEKMAMRLQLVSLPADHPRWKVFIVRAPSPAKSAVIVHAHHSMGDGLGMLFAMSPLMGVEGGNPLSKVPLPNILLPPFARNTESRSERLPPSSSSRSKCGFLGSLCQNIRDFWRGFLSMPLTKYDAELCINEPYTKRKPRLTFTGKRQLTRLPAVPLSLIKQAREQHSCTLNDIVMAGITGALRKYCIEVGKDEKVRRGDNLDFKSMIMLALPRECSKADPTTGLRNNMLFSTVGLPLSEPDQSSRVRKCMANLSGLKSAGYVLGLRTFTQMMASVAPRAILNKVTGETWSKHTLLVTNVPCTSVPLTFPAEEQEGGQELKEISLVIANVMSQISVVSYNGFLYATLVADPDLISEAKKLGDFWMSEMKELAAQ